MKIKCSKTELIKGINIVSKAVPVRTTLNIQECILIDAGTSSIKLTANDLELGIETKIEGEIEERGIAALNAKMFSDIVRKLPESDVTITATEDLNVTIVCEKAKFRIMARAWDEFSGIPMIPRENPIVISSFTLKEVIRQTIFSIAVNESNKIMTGEYFEIHDNMVRLISLDGHRISLRKIALNQSYPDAGVVIPGKTLSEISKILSGDADSMVEICIAENHIMFVFEQTVVVSRLIDGKYFEVDHMITYNYETKVTIHRRELLECIDRSILLVREEDRKPIVMDIGDGGVHLQIISQLGSMDETIEAETGGRNVTIGFNPKYLLDAIRAIDDEYIDMYFMNGKAPCIIRNQEDTYLYLVLPVNIIV